MASNKKQLAEVKKTFKQDEGLVGNLDMVITRFDKMQGAQQPFQAEWDVCDQQFEAEIIEDPYTGQVLINTNLEQALIETEVGRIANQIVFDVKPAGYRATSYQLESGKYVLQSFLDKENFYDTFRTRKQDKARYGTGVWFTGLRYDIEFIPTYEKQTVETELGDGFFSDKINEQKKENWFFTPQNVPIRTFFIDDRYLYQNDFNKVEDVVLVETLSQDAAKLKYGGNSFMNQEALEINPIADEEPWYGVPAPRGMMVLYHYFNKVTKDYIIVVNRSALLYEGKMTYRHGKLPFDVCQHYPDSACIYGISIPRKVRVPRAYKVNIMQSIMDGSRLNSGKIILANNTGENQDGDFSMPSGGINIARITNGIGNYQVLDTQVDINSSINALQIVSDETMLATGINPLAPFQDLGDEKLGQTEIKEANKAIRQKSVDELMNQSLDRVLTMTLSNIAQFAPVLLKRITTVKDENGKELETLTQWPQIQINNVTIEKKKGQTVITEDYGNYGFLELKPETLEGDLTVNVITPSTYNEVMTVLEKNKIKEMMTSYVEFANTFGPQYANQIMPADKVIEKWRQAYGYEEGQMAADTKRDVRAKENKAKMDALMQAISGENLLLNPEINGQQPAPQGTPTAPTGLRQTEIGATAAQGQTIPLQ